MIREAYSHIITVIGKGAFPIDMLRKERLLPVSDKDSRKIERTHRDKKTKPIELHRWAASTWSPDKKSWELKGWQVVKHTWRNIQKEVRI